MVPAFATPICHVGLLFVSVMPDSFLSLCGRFLKSAGYIAIRRCSLLTLGKGDWDDVGAEGKVLIAPSPSPRAKAEVSASKHSNVLNSCDLKTLKACQVNDRAR
jgi:hypothetical protein